MIGAKIRRARVYSQCFVREPVAKPARAAASIPQPRFAAAARRSPIRRRCIRAPGSRTRKAHRRRERLPRLAAGAIPKQSEPGSFCPQTSIHCVYFSTNAGNLPTPKGCGSPLYDRGRRVDVAYRPIHRRIHDTWTALKRWFQRAEPEAPEDPYAYVGAPKKPRTPRRSAAAKAEP